MAQATAKMQKKCCLYKKPISTSLDELANSLSEQRAFSTPRKNTEQDKVNREQSNQDRVNCALRGLYQLGGVCVNTCPPDWVAEPRGKFAVK